MTEWDTYIDNIMGHTEGHCDKACLIGKSGGKWTSDTHPNAIKISVDEASTIGKAMESGDLTPFQSSGIVVEGVKYQFLRGEENLVIGKKKDHGGITIQGSQTAVVIGHTKEGGQPGNTNKGVAVIAEYLESVGM